MLIRLLLALAWLALGVATAWAPRSLTFFLAEEAGLTTDVAGALVWGLIALELGLGLGLILSCRLAWLRPLGALSLLLSLGFLVLILLVKPLRTCDCFGLLDARPFLHKLIVLGALVYLSALAAWPRPAKMPARETVQL